MAEIIETSHRRGPAPKSVSHWLAGKICNSVLAMDIDAAALVLQGTKARAFDAEISLDSGMSKFAGTRDARNRYRVTDDGIAIVAVQGILIDRGDWLGDLGGFATSYEGLTEQMQRIGKDDAIKAVILDIDSGGGMAAGMNEAAAAIAHLGKTKKVYAIAANMAASAAYALGCAASEFYLTSGAMVGSIGVIKLHMSYAGMLDQSGIEATITQAGKNKSNGNPYQPLSNLARSEFSTEVDDFYDQFVRYVAKHRPLSEDKVRETEARVYYGEKGVAAKLADGVMSFDDLLTHVRKGVKTPARGKSPKKGGRMSDDNPAASRPDYDAVIAAAVSSLAAASQSIAKPTTAAVAAAPVEKPATSPVATASDADRVWGILDSDEAKTRPGLARHLAQKTAMSVDDARAVLVAAPAEQSAAEVQSEPPAKAGLESALHKEMKKAANTGGVKPEGTNAEARRRFSDLAAEVPAKKKGMFA